MGDAMEPSTARQGVGLALSGGGYRAMLFHTGERMKITPGVKRDWGRQLLRVLDVIDNQVRELRTGALLKAYVEKDFAGTYWGSYSDLENFELPDSLPAPVELTHTLAETPTRLTKLPEVLQERLMNWGYAACDAGMRRWVDPAAVAPKDFPFPAAGVG
jgi:NTE family protein